MKDKKRKNNFFDQVFSVAKKIPKGRVMTYEQIAKELGTRDARKVGWALHSNKNRDVPCHRVVNKQGGLAKNFASGGWKEQRKRLLEESVVFEDEMHVDLGKCSIIR